ncbi:MAG: hypothetical protein R6V05_09570 [Candidatus Brocadiia bacterium]
MSELIDTDEGTAGHTSLHAAATSAGTGAEAAPALADTRSGIAMGDTTGGPSSGLLTDRQVLGERRIRSRQAANSWRRVRQQLGSAVEALEAAIDAATDMVSRSNAIDQAAECLEALWGLRDTQTDEFAEVVAMLRGLFEQRDAESMEPDELTCLCEVLNRFAREPALDEERANELTSLMIRRGVDVYRGLR